jgi:hypothetical protein
MRTRNPSDMLFLVLVGMSRRLSRLADAIGQAFQAMPVARLR